MNGETAAASLAEAAEHKATAVHNITEAKRPQLKNMLEKHYKKMGVAAKGKAKAKSKNKRKPAAAKKKAAELSNSLTSKDREKK
jgi:hypothetical protein